jgi:hypothetical protein
LAEQEDAKQAAQVEARQREAERKASPRFRKAEEILDLWTDPRDETEAAHVEQMQICYEENDLDGFHAQAGLLADYRLKTMNKSAEESARNATLAVEKAAKEQSDLERSKTAALITKNPDVS